MRRYYTAYALKLGAAAIVFMFGMIGAVWIGLPSPWLWSTMFTMLVQQSVLRKLL